MTATIYPGDCLASLRRLPDGVARTCVTSPPYYGLRDYGTATWEGGDPACDHRPNVKSRATRPLGKLHGGFATIDASTVQRDCHCGARRIDDQIGLEETPEAYVARLVEVFREVRRVLADDGTLWLNLGDSYAGPANSGGQNRNDGGPAVRLSGLTPKPGKPKDLLGIPWRVAFALQADGWYLRSDIIWHKPNPMPESVRDRPTKAHEYVFLLSKRERYYYDAAAIAEAAANPDGFKYAGGYKNTLHMVEESKRVNVGSARLANGTVPHFKAGHGEARNARTVWTIATQPYPEAHFATFPEELPSRCIRAGSAPGDTVLDPFAGTGTTGAVAVGLGRSAILCELNPAYIELARQRIGPMLCEVAA